MEKYDVVIIGGGLSSLTTAAYLSKRLRNVAVFEEGSRRKLQKYSNRLKDEFNNKFQPVFYSGIDPQNFNMRIFNRFGELIFESNDASLGWDGDYGAGRGLVQPGVYTFKIEFSTSTKDEKKLVVGSINVLR